MVETVVKKNKIIKKKQQPKYLNIGFGNDVASDLNKLNNLVNQKTKGQIGLRNLNLKNLPKEPTKSSYRDNRTSDSFELISGRN